MSMHATATHGSAPTQIANDGHGLEQTIEPATLRRELRYLVAAAVTGGLIAGTLNLLYGLIAYGLIGVTSLQLLQCIASGVFGPAAFHGGLTSAACGVVIHFGLSIAMAGAFVALATKLPALLAQPVFWGALYGVALFFLMTYVVVPLSAAAPHASAPPWPLYKAGLIVHAFLVGLPITLMARHFLMPEPVEETLAD